MLSLRIVSFGRLERDFGLQKSAGEESERGVGHYVYPTLATRPSLISSLSLGGYVRSELFRIPIPDPFIFHLIHFLLCAGTNA